MKVAEVTVKYPTIRSLVCSERLKQANDVTSSLIYIPLWTIPAVCSKIKWEETVFKDYFQRGEVLTKRRGSDPEERF